MKLLVVDHEDSFVYNLAQGFEGLGADVRVMRCRRPLRDAVKLDPDAVVLSPGPGAPDDPRLTRMGRALLDRWSDERPFFGVCLGHQMIGAHFGGRVTLAKTPVHGATAAVYHDGMGVFAGLRSPFPGARYHSLVVAARALPADLERSAWTGDGVVMGLRHRRRPIHSVQFHPESYLTPGGPRILQNFLAEVRR